MDLFYELGEYGPLLLIMVAISFLWKYKYLFYYFSFGLFMNTILNIFLKGFIQEPRPTFDATRIKLAKSHAKNYFYQNGIPFDIFGMPSGHAEMSFYITVFLYLALKNTHLSYFCFFFSLLICYQRVKYNYHSISQVIVGSIVGSAFAYLIYRTSREKIKGEVKEKPDNNAPV
jgi:membrane-associated phospholipid phosphatase